MVSLADASRISFVAGNGGVGTEKPSSTVLPWSARLRAISPSMSESSRTVRSGLLHPMIFPGLIRLRSF